MRKNTFLILSFQTEQCKLIKKKIIILTLWCIANFNYFQLSTSGIFHKIIHKLSLYDIP